MRTSVFWACAALFGIVVLGFVSAARSLHPAETRAGADSGILFTNVHVFDGVRDARIEDTRVLVVGEKIAAIGADLQAGDGVTVIDGGGRTLMPGLIDMHWHSLFATVPQAQLYSADISYMALVGAQANEAALLRGFTTVRDVGGNVFALKRATDEGRYAGPRIYPSGPYLSQTSGHGDFRGPNDVPSHPGKPLDYFAAAGISLVADGVPAVMQRTREALRMGATQIKVMAGGGVSSSFDPLDVTQYTFEEMKAIVDVARTWNTYVAVHAFSDASVQQAIRAGVQCIEHGHLLGEETLRMMSDRGVWLSMQPILDDEDAIPFPEGSPNRAKFIEVTTGTDRVYRLAKKLGVKIVWGTDTLFSEKLAKRQGAQLAKLGRWFTPHEALVQATSRAGELLKCCGPRDPYPGALGVVAKGAWADLILVDGNPLEDLSVLAEPAERFVVVMKNGVVYKNTLP